ncbi:tetratricopeptide repeat protein [Hymenobacter aerilatus]|uniref:Tetratricopeptide repeat protein n=1 Tax=Hymenobacter aerilatus TaxID=2932251 RepID=A0A8T9T0C4_9BACT|nr:tetratricopeptide repeat-containing sensor histidine kinase [Hymenobacter aerilatus]UOR06433.1 tetratricopeptide repeat protein [Hymenobacter aerilatus]
MARQYPFGLCWILLLLLYPLAGSSQTVPLPPVPDSLRTVVSVSSPPTAAALLRVAQAYMGPFDSAGVVGYARAAERAAYQTQQPHIAGQALDLRGDYYRQAGRPALALPLLQRAGQQLATAPTRLRAENRYHLGMALGDLGQPGRALVLYGEASRLDPTNRELQAQLLNSTGLIYARQSRLDSAAACFFRSLRRAEGLPAGTGPAAATLGNLGRVYLRQGRWRESARYLRQGMALEAADLDTMGLASSWQFLGEALLGQPDSLAAALACFRRSERLARRSHLANYLPTAWLLLGRAYEQRGQPDSAQHYLTRAVAAQQARGAAGVLAPALMALAEFRGRQGQWAAAEQAAQRAEVAPGATLPLRAQGWEVRRRAALARHDYPAAYAALVRQQAVLDSVRARDNQQLTELMRAAYETDEAELQVSALRHEGELLRLRQQRLLLVLVLGAVLLLAGAGLGLSAYRRRQLRRELALRTRLSADLHDEVGGLLTQISMQTNLLGAGLYSPDEQQAHLQEVATASRAAAAQLQDVVWGYDAHNDTTGSLLDRMRDYAYELLGGGERTLLFTADAAQLPPQLPMETRRALYLIFKEALHNVAKHAPLAQQVSVALAAEEAGLVLTVADDAPAPTKVPRASGHGLRNMAARAEAVGGSCITGYGAVPNQPGWGVQVRVPVG